MTFTNTIRNLVLKHRVHARNREQSLLVRASDAIGMDRKDAIDFRSRIQGKQSSTFGTDYDLSPAAMS